MPHRILGLIVLTGLATAGPVAAQQFVQLPPGSWATDVTPDGEVVVGSDGNGEGLIWRWRVDPAPTSVPGGYFTAVSADGTVACGNIPDPGGSGFDVAAVWDETSGWLSLGWLPNATIGGCGSALSTAYDISADGTTVVGLSWEGCDGRGFIWSAGNGMQELMPLANGHNRCSAISGDGLVLGGFAQGTFNRTPAYWSWDASGAVLDPDLQGEVYSFNYDGSTSVGTLYFSGSSFGAFVRDTQTGALTDLGSLQSGWGGIASDLSEDSSVIVGFDSLMLARKAWVWTAGDGMIGLKERLTAQGLVGVPNLLTCNAVSVDGTVIVGGGETGSGGPGAFMGYIAELPTTPALWANLLGGLAGTAGVPKLAGTGPLTAGSPTNLTLSQAKPLSQSALAVGLSAANLPFKQGVLVPFPTWLFFFPLGGSGSLSLNFNWPNGLPSGFKMYWQFMIKDTAAPAAVSLSNALRSQTP